MAKELVVKLLDLGPVRNAGHALLFTRLPFDAIGTLFVVLMLAVFVGEIIWLPRLPIGRRIAAGLSIQLLIGAATIVFLAALRENFEGCLGTGPAQICYGNGATLDVARTIAASLEAHPPDARLRVRLMRNGGIGGPLVVLLAPPVGDAPAPSSALEALGARFYATPGLGPVDVFITDARWEAWRLVRPPSPVDRSSASCCDVAVPAAAPVVPMVTTALSVPSGGRIAEGTYVLASFESAVPLPPRSARGALRLGGGEMHSEINFDAPGQASLDDPPMCQIDRYRVDGPRLVATKVCPPCTDGGCDFTYRFTATDGGLTLFTGDGDLEGPRTAMTFLQRSEQKRPPRVAPGLR